MPKNNSLSSFCLWFCAWKFILYSVDCKVLRWNYIGKPWIFRCFDKPDRMDVDHNLKMRLIKNHVHVSIFTLFWMPLFLKNTMCTYAQRNICIQSINIQQVNFLQKRERKVHFGFCKFSFLRFLHSIFPV